MAKKKSIRDRMKQKLKDRTKESHNRRDSGGSFKNFFNSDKIGELEVSTWWAGKGDHLIDIIPYFAGKNDPRNEEGEPSYVLDIEAHMRVGALSDVLICPEQFGKPCPICEESRRLDKAGEDWKTVVKPLKPKRRVVYNVIVRDEGKMEEKGVQVLEISHYFMEAHLAKIAKSVRGGGFTVFSDPDEGRSIAFERSGGSENTAYTGHHFEDRPANITDEELDSAYCLDDLIEIRSYADIYESFHGKPFKDEENGDEENGDEENGDEENGGDELTAEDLMELGTVRKLKKCIKAYEIELDDDEIEDCADADELRELIADELDLYLPEPNDEPEPEPTKAELRAEKKAKAKADKEEKAKAKKAKADAKKKKDKKAKCKKADDKAEGAGDGCPHGHTIGEDIDEHRDCDDCKIYDSCSDIADDM